MTALILVLNLSVLPWAFLFSCLSVLAFYLVFRVLGLAPRVVPLLVPTWLVALLVETYIFSLIGYTTYAPIGTIILALVLVAPVVEETLKFLSSWFGKDPRAGFGAGLGFALAENTFYVAVFIGMGLPAAELALWIGLRLALDPALHSLASGVSSLSWTRGKRNLAVAIMIHSAYNAAAILSILFWGAIEVACIQILVLLLGAAYLFKVMDRPGPEVSREKGQAGLTHGLTAGLTQLRLVLRRRSPAAVNSEAAKASEKETADPSPFVPNLGTLGKFTASVDMAIKTQGFQVVASSLGLDRKYEETRWIRRAVLVDERGISRYMEAGLSGVLAVVGIVALIVFVIVEVFV